LAGPGEFTQRAFLNGRIDLVQAEAVIDTIRARTRAGLQAAHAAANGALSRALHDLRDKLLNALARLEAAVDFPEDDLPELIDDALVDSLRAVHEEMKSLLATADAGRLVREGVTVAIAGRPNVGKSSLFNALLRDTRAIVSAQAGTTRDRLEEYITLGGVPVRLVDTAGLRQTEDEVERIGVDMARDVLQSAACVLLVLDGSAPAQPEDDAIADELREIAVPVLVVLNKLDLSPTPATPAWAAGFDAVCSVSALTGAGMSALEARLEKTVLAGAHVNADQPMLNRLHQKDSLRRAIECVGRVVAEPDRSPEFLALDVQQALREVGAITGETTPDDVLEQIFSAFCIGK